MGRREALALSLMALLIAADQAFAADTSQSPYEQWSRGPGGGTDFFPIAVWLQNPAKAERYTARRDSICTSDCGEVPPRSNWPSFGRRACG